jgi:hypothetical protein
MVYKLSIESNSENVLREIQQWVNTNYNCDKILWNDCKEISYRKFSIINN